ncbi:MAG: nicotinamide riboside transporter PnuC [Chitinophagaceae bacterium]
MDTFKILEYIGVALWVVYLTLAVQEKIACWIFGILASCITIVNFYHSKIYSEALVNCYYVFAGAYGWYNWSRHQKENKSARVPVQVWSLSRHIVFYVATALVALTWGIVMHRHTDSPKPYIDATTAAFSFLTTYMEARKVLTTWLNWFVINLCLVYLQVDRHIPLYAGLSAFFALMSIRGYFKWRQTWLLSK